MIEREGPGWRLAIDSTKRKFPVLLGGDNWSIELTQEEWDLLLPLIEELLGQFKALKQHLMPEELLFLELDRRPWWGCIDGDMNSWSLQLILEGDDMSVRGLEIFWPSSAALSITSAMRSAWDSSQ